MSRSPNVVGYPSVDEEEIELPSGESDTQGVKFIGNVDVEVFDLEAPPGDSARSLAQCNPNRGRLPRPQPAIEKLLQHARPTPRGADNQGGPLAKGRCHDRSGSPIDFLQVSYIRRINTAVRRCPNHQLGNRHSAPLEEAEAANAKPLV